MNAGDEVAKVVQAHMVVRGFVQGVGFRMCARDAAARLGLRGWVRNQRDESVEVVVEGPRGAVDEFIEWCRRGPSRAQVKCVVPTYGPATGEFVDFRIRS